MCEYCNSTKGHLMGCPNAPEPEIIGKCYKCGAVIEEGDKYEDTIHGFLCERCDEEERREEYLDDLIERDTPRKPEYLITKDKELTVARCRCGNLITAWADTSSPAHNAFCPKCGQRIDWS